MSDLRVEVKFFYDVQGLRIKTANRLHIKKNGEETEGDHPVLENGVWEIYDNFLNGTPQEDGNRKGGFKQMEATLLKQIANIVHEHPLWIGFLKDIKGVGELMAAVIISEFNIHIATTVSKMWKFAGLYPGAKLTKGEKAPYNKWLRTKLCGVLGASFLKSKSPYSEFYYDYKNRWVSAEKGKSDMHRHKAATRYMIKMFLIDLYVFWRTLEGLPVRPPYQEEYLGHKHDTVEPIAYEDVPKVYEKMFKGKIAYVQM